MVDRPVKQDLPSQDREEISNFIKSIKAQPPEERHAAYDFFTDEFVDKRISILGMGVDAAKKEAEDQVEASNDKASDGNEIDDLLDYSTPDSKPKGGGFAEAVIKSRGNSNEPPSR
jgi:hypothetical protein